MNKNTLATARSCDVVGCDRKHYARGCCKSHYEYTRRGDIAPTQLLPIGQARSLSVEERFWAKVVKTDNGCWEWRGSINSNGYGLFSIHGVLYRVHRVSWAMKNGTIPEGKLIDHQCRNKTCVNPNHLKPVTNKENMENTGVCRRNKSGYRGVFWDSRASKWVAAVIHHGEQIYVGSYDDAKSAGEAARLKRNELYSNNLLDRSGASV